MKPTPIEKFQYLVHLKATNPHLFYRLLSKNIKVRVPGLTLRGTPTDVSRN
jgi:malate dehydrogenase (oxaloacetate-decarboxylating)(NADP+)